MEREQASDYGKSGRGPPARRIVIDLSSPNIAKPMSRGAPALDHHRRGDPAPARRAGLQATVGINHIGDWGSQFGKLVCAIQRWGDTVDLENGSDPGSLLALYVRYHEEEEQDPTLDEAARTRRSRSSRAARTARCAATWRHLTELSMREFDKHSTRAWG